MKQPNGAADVPAAPLAPICEAEAKRSAPSRDSTSMVRLMLGFYELGAFNAESNTVQRRLHCR